MPRHPALAFRPPPPPSTPTTDGTTSDNPSSATDTTSTTSTISDGDSILTCPHCDHTFTSSISLISHLRIHRTKTGESVPRAPTHSRDHGLHCPHCTRAFYHRMSLFGHMRIHDRGTHRDSDTSNTSCNHSQPSHERDHHHHHNQQQQQ
ncbi:unnamed protein product [Schistocephalus solidus]|uniref:C2H2-type domain-containing protein n=1 Tax=Schistocephalus solidus TaxID=70667 RepID=A0A183TIY7_SCHSO|nr:unnamed protein product [Schistocephalus solidus]